MKNCVLCRSAENDELLFGKFYTKNILVHEKCLYLSSNLDQRRYSRNVLSNFDIGDIRTVVERVSELKCCYCSRLGANIECNNMFCSQTFHTGCGIRRHAQNQFIGVNNSFCHWHVNGYKERPDPYQNCNICLEQLLNGEEFKCTSHIHGKCCQQGWYHKLCLQRYANSAGNSFKCPLCNNSKKFRLVREYGILVPDCPASWENDAMYETQFALETRCTATDCIATNGREADEMDLLYCLTCGSNPMHPECTSFHVHEYRCNTCAAVLGTGNLECLENYNWAVSESPPSVTDIFDGSASTIESITSEDDNVVVNGSDDGSEQPVSDRNTDSVGEVDPFEQFFQEQYQQPERRDSTESSFNGYGSTAARDLHTDWDEAFLQDEREYETDKENKVANYQCATQTTVATASPATITSPRLNPNSLLSVRYLEQEAYKPIDEGDSDLVVDDEEPPSKKMKEDDKKEPSSNNIEKEDGQEEPSSNNKEKEEEKPSSSNTKENENKEAQELASAQTNPSPNLISSRAQRSRPNIEQLNCIARRTRSHLSDKKQ